MSGISLITFFVDFFVNDLFGHVFLSVLFLVLIILSILWFARVPKIGISIFALFLLTGLASSGFVPVWVGILTWVVLGLLWGAMFLSLIR